MLTQAGQWQETVGALPMTDGKGHNIYTFELTGLPKGSYAVSETERPDDCQPPKYYIGSELQVGYSEVGSGGIIANDAMGVELPSTGSHLTAGLVLALGAALLLASGAALTIRTRGRRKAEE